MIEMVYKGKDKDGKDERRLPKNVRQIGEAGKGKRYTWRIMLLHIFTR